MADEPKKVLTKAYPDNVVQPSKVGKKAEPSIFGNDVKHQPVVKPAVAPTTTAPTQ